LNDKQTWKDKETGGEFGRSGTQGRKGEYEEKKLKNFSPQGRALDQGPKPRENN